MSTIFTGGACRLTGARVAVTTHCNRIGGPTRPGDRRLRHRWVRVAPHAGHLSRAIAE